MSDDYDLVLDASPLNHKGYAPRFTPIGGVPPDEVAQWGPKSQYRWFHRFRQELKPLPHKVWDRFYVDSTAHRGLCCESCADDRISGYGIEDYCCCKAQRD